MDNVNAWCGSKVQFCFKKMYNLKDTFVVLCANEYDYLPNCKIESIILLKQMGSRASALMYQNNCWFPCFIIQINVKFMPGHLIFDHLEMNMTLGSQFHDKRHSLKYRKLSYSSHSQTNISYPIKLTTINSIPPQPSSWQNVCRQTIIFPSCSMLKIIQSHSEVISLFM